MGNVPELLARVREWSRAHTRELIFAAIIFLVASLSFGLGYLANRELNHATIVIEKIAD